MTRNKIFVIGVTIGLLFLPVVVEAQDINNNPVQQYDKPIEGYTGFQARVSKNLGIPEEDFAVCIERSKPGSTWDNTTHDSNFEKKHPNMTKVKYTKERETKITLLKCLREKLPNLTQKRLNEAMK